MALSPAITPRRRRTAWVLVTLALVLVTAGVLAWFQPQKLWIDERAEDLVPDAAAASGPEARPAPGNQPPTPGPVELARGRFVTRDHETAGAVRVLSLGEGARVVRLEGLETSNGPDLYVYLTANRAAGPEGAFDDEYVSLGRLKANRGDQNYEVPAPVDLHRLATVVIWCDRFNSAFGAADLAED